MNDFERVANILNELASDNSRNFKKDLLLQHKDDNQLALVFRLAYDPYIKFNIARVRLTEGYFAVGDHEYKFEQFIKDLEVLINREKTGNDALDFVETIYYNLPELFQPYLEKILQKDLKIGVSTATINEIWPEWIPGFKLGLCERYKKVKNLSFPYYGEPKIDGVRVIAHVKPTPHVVEMYSRSGIKYNNFSVIEQELLNSDYNNVFLDQDRIKEHGLILDGEIDDKDFNGIMGNARRIYDVNCLNAKFRIWDILYGDEFFEETCSMTLEERKMALDLILFSHESHIEVLRWESIENLEELVTLFKKYYHQGYEGVILKDPKSYYIFSSGSKRGKVWIKYKIQNYNEEIGNEGVSEYSVTVTDFYPGEQNTKFRDVLGGFTYKGIATLKDGTQVDIQGRCGGGYKDQQRFEFWERKEKLIGLIMDVESQEVTTDKDGLHSLRFPVFQRFRPDLIAESSN